MAHLSCIGFLFLFSRNVVTAGTFFVRIENVFVGVPVVAQWLTNPTRNQEVAGSIPGLAQWVKDLALLWLWCRPAATAPIRPLA